MYWETKANPKPEGANTASHVELLTPGHCRLILQSSN